jgi:hypothetical protein
MNTAVFPRSTIETIAFVAGDTEDARAALARLTARYGNIEPEQADVIVALGGDGLMLQTLHRFMNGKGASKPIYGMHRGSVGFLMNDFREDHTPGQDYHGDALIRRYDAFTVTRDPNNHIVSHCTMDKATGWLYVVDHGGQRVLRMNTRTGTNAGAASYGPWESYVEYSRYINYEWEVIVDSGLEAPAGIDIIGDHLLVSDALKPSAIACLIDRAPRKWQQPSDHAPVVLELDPGRATD